MRIQSALILCLFAFTAGCSEEVGKKTDDGAAGGPPVDDGAELSIEVPATGRAFVALAKPEVVTVPDDGATSSDWDLAFSGYDIFTNGGLSGPGDGAAFPLDASDFESGTAPDVPFLIEDEAGGAFADWYAYDPAEHVVWSRYHLYGVTSGDRYWKVQVVTFYGEVQGAPVPALYKIRYAEVTQAGPGPTTELEDVDATAGGSMAPEDQPSAFLDLATGAIQQLTPAEAKESTTWQLGFRRAQVSVNGELGGPGDTRAVDLDFAATEGEKLDEVKMKTAASELARFEAIGYAELTAPGLDYRGDHIVTAFSGRWVDAASSPPAPVRSAAFLVQSADGIARHIFVVDRFEGASDASPGTVVIRVKPIQ